MTPIGVTQAASAGVNDCFARPCVAELTIAPATEDSSDADAGGSLVCRRSDGRLAPGSAADAIVSRDDRRRTNAATWVEVDALLEYA